MSFKQDSSKGGIDSEHADFGLSRRSALKGLAGAGLLGLVGIPALSGSVAAQPSAQVSLVQSDTDSSITGRGSSGLGYDPSSAAAYQYLVNDATFTSVSANAVPSPYHDSVDSLGSYFDTARWVWHDATGSEQPADELVRIEETFTLSNMAGQFRLTYAADNYAVVFLNGTYIGGVTWAGTVSQDVSGFLVHGENTIEMRAWNAPHGAVDSPAGAIYELMGPAQPTAVDLSIDVKPGNGDETDPISPNGRGKVPVAVYSTDDFDATTLNVSTLRFGSSAVVDADGGASAAHGGHVEDVDGDGLVDLMLHFPSEDAGFADGDTEAKLVGQTDDGTDAVGTDAVRIVGDKGKRNGRGR